VKIKFSEKAEILILKQLSFKVIYKSTGKTAEVLMCMDILKRGYRRITINGRLFNNHRKS